MLQQKTSVTSSDGGDAPRIHHHPQNGFESELVRSFLRSKLPEKFKFFGCKMHQVEAVLSVGSEWSEWVDGWLPFTVEIPTCDTGFEFALLYGKVRLLENPWPASERFRLVADWLMPEQADKGFQILQDQANHAPCLPVILEQPDRSGSL